MNFLKIKHYSEPFGYVDNVSDDYKIKSLANFEDDFFHTQNSIVLDCVLQPVVDFNYDCMLVNQKFNFQCRLYSKFPNLISAINVVLRNSGEVLYTKKFEIISKNINVNLIKNYFEQFGEDESFSSKYIPIGGKYDKSTGKAEQEFCKINFVTGSLKFETKSLSDIVKLTPNFNKYTSLHDDVCNGFLQYNKSGIIYKSHSMQKLTTTTDFCSIKFC